MHKKMKWIIFPIVFIICKLSYLLDILAFKLCKVWIFTQFGLLGIRTSRKLGENAVKVNK